MSWEPCFAIFICVASLYPFIIREHIVFSLFVNPVEGIKILSPFVISKFTRVLKCVSTITILILTFIFIKRYRAAIVLDVFPSIAIVFRNVG